MGQGWIEMGNWILVYICDDIASKLTPKDISDREGFFPELNFGKKNGCYVALTILTATLLTHIWIVLERLLTHSLQDSKTLF